MTTADDNLIKKRKSSCGGCGSEVVWEGRKAEANDKLFYKYGWKNGRCRSCQSKSAGPLFRAIGRMG